MKPVQKFIVKHMVQIVGASDIFQNPAHVFLNLPLSVLTECPCVLLQGIIFLSVCLLYGFPYRGAPL